MTEPDYRALLKRSLVAIEQLEGKLAAVERARTEPIAIVGVGCRFPGKVRDPASYWQLLIDGVDAVTVAPPERWDAEAFFDPDPDAEGKTYSKWGGFIEDVDRFDAQLFGVSPREALNMDPQHRQLLEVTWEALENAAIAPSSLAGSRTGVYIGISGLDYGTEANEVFGKSRGDAYTASGNAHSIASGRISYFLGVHGPNLAVDTACSSSMVAMHLAVQSLRSRESNMALAGSVNLILSPTGAILTSRARMMSFDGRCKTFDASADGYVRADGVGMLVLKRLSDAQKDGDRILAVIRGSALNQDGRSSGLTAPNGVAQEAAIREAIANGGLSPSDIDVVEAHGTGTSLGDPIEVNALGRVFRDHDPTRPVLIASVKANIGHCEASAGAASVIKAVLSLQHRMVPPHLHMKVPNPLIAWQSLPIKVPQAPTPWPTAEGRVRRISVSSFGFSGTNAHMVLEEAPAAPEPAPSDSVMRLVVLSAQTQAALREHAVRFRAHFLRPDAGAWQDIVFTAGVGRSHLPERLAVVAKDAAQAAERLGEFIDDRAGAATFRGRAAPTQREVAFLFTGQGAQSFGMARELYASQPVYRRALDACAAIVDPILEKPLLSVIMNDESLKALVDDTAYTQPALFSVEYGLAQLWKSWGVEPTIVLGHSVGEYVAACVAGLFSLEDGLRLIAHRGRLMSRLPRDGTMAAVFADEARVREALRGFENDVSIGAVNGPESIVISGRTTAVDQIVARFAASGVDAQKLNVSHAFHSPLMDPMLGEFEKIAATMTFSSPRIGLVSNVSGKMAGDEVKTPGYWRRHVREAVRFSDGIATLHAEKIRIFVEVGPSPTLLRMAARCPGPSETVYLPSLRKGAVDTESMLQTLAELYLAGQTVDWRALAGPSAKRIVLPTYPFQRDRYWHDLTPPAAKRGPVGKSTGHPLLATRLTSPLRIYQGDLSVEDKPWLADHAIFGVTLFPVTGFLEVALAAARDTLGGENVALEGVTIAEGLSLPAEGGATLQVVVTPAADNKHTIEVFSAEVAPDVDPVWRRHVSATAGREAKVTPASGIPTLPAEGSRSEDAGAYYARLAERGANYGPAFRGIQEMTIAGNEALGRVSLPAELASGAKQMQLHPALLDACLQVVGAALPSDTLRPDSIFVPVGLDRYRVFREGVTDVRCHAAFEEAKPGAPFIRTNVTLFAEDGTTIAELRGLEFQRVTPEALQRLTQGVSRPEWLLEVEWQATEAPNSRAIEAGERWLILDRGGPLAFALADDLARRGVRAAVVSHGDAYEKRADGWTIDTTKPDHYLRLLKQAAEEDPRPWTNIVWLPSPGSDESDLPALRNAHRATIAPLLALIPAIAELGARLWLVTRGAQAVLGSMPSLVEAPLSALGNVLGSEIPALRAVRIDMDPASRPDDVAVLSASLCADDAEDRVAIRGGKRFVARLATGTLTPSDVGAPHRLEIDERGVLENLKWRAVPREAPGPGAVEVHVLATGLNFRDVLNALGMYPGDPGPLGNECAGVVTAVGEGVDQFAVGDEVITMIDRSFATFVVAPASLTVKKPPNLTFAEAATIPVTFLTAEYALTTLSHMKKGDRVLVHAATGGVGMAAMQLARRAGAEIFATAGSPAKRALALSLGAHHVSDSRSLTFVDDFKKATGGEGLDIVLNSLAGDFIPASLGLLRKGGRFVEIGKTGIWDKETVAKSYPGIEYFPLYLGEIAAKDPDRICGMLERLMEEFGRGELTPLPRLVYPIERAEEAFRFMAQGRHTGKIVITQHDAPQVRPDATYLVTGGLGGLGLVCARGLAERGAKHVVLLGRRAPSAEAQQVIDALTQAGVTAVAMQGDVGTEADVAAVLEKIRTTMPPLRGILHAAGSVDDGLVAEQSLERFERIMAPKVDGTWHLQAHARKDPLDFFVLFSSGAALLGSPGQSNYAFANGFMDALAFHRKAEGRPALSINWGSWSDVGMAAAVSEQHRRRWAEGGIRLIRPSEGVRMMHDTLRGTRSAQIAILPLDRARLSPLLGPFFQRLLETAAKGTAAPENVPTDLPQRLAEAAPEGRAPIVTAFLVDQLVRVLAVDAATRLHTDQSLMDMGLDSLMAMELRNRVQAAVKVRLSVAELLTGQTIEQLALKILGAMDLGGAPAAAPAAAPQEAATYEEGSL